MSNRQLAVYDFAVQPCLGEFYLFLQTSLSLCARLGIEDVDLCVVCDPSRIRNSAFLPLQAEGALRGKLFDLLNLTQFHPMMRNILIVDSLDQAVAMAQRTDPPYRSCWPTVEMFSSDVLINGQFTMYANCAILDKLHHGQEITTPLRPRPALADWAAKFVADHCRGRMPVTVNLRNNPAHYQSRNMVGNVWRDFFDRAEVGYDVTFLLLGAANEDFSVFRGCPSVVITKDWHTSIEQDIALIEHAHMHMGSSSGPVTSLLFMGKKPALCVNGDALIVDDLHNYHGTLGGDGAYLRFTFGNPNFRMTITPQTTDSLIHEFDSMLQVLTVQASEREAEALRLKSACNKGMELQLAGQVDQALQIYRNILAAAPQQPMANYCMGMLLVQSMRASEGLQHLKSALLADLDVSDYWLGYMEALLLVNRENEAYNILGSALRRGFKGAAFEDISKRVEVARGAASTGVI
jgi:hypothetical protein